MAALTKTWRNHFHSFVFGGYYAVIKKGLNAIEWRVEIRDVKTHRTTRVLGSWRQWTDAVRKAERELAELYRTKQ